MGVISTEHDDPAVSLRQAAPCLARIVQTDAGIQTELRTSDKYLACARVEIDELCFRATTAELAFGSDQRKPGSDG